MSKMNFLDWLAYILIVVGSINWGLVAINPSLNLVEFISFGMNWLSKSIYGLVGLSGIYAIYTIIKIK